MTGEPELTTPEPKELFASLDVRIRSADTKEFRVIPCTTDLPYSLEKPTGFVYELDLPGFKISVSQHIPPFGCGVQYLLRVFEGTQCIAEFGEDTRDRQELRTLPIRATYQFIQERLHSLKIQEAENLRQATENEQKQRHADSLRRLATALGL